MAGNKIEVVIDVKTEKVTFAGGEVKNLRQQAKLLNEELNLIHCILCFFSRIL